MLAPSYIGPPKHLLVLTRDESEEYCVCSCHLTSRQVWNRDLVCLSVCLSAFLWHTERAFWGCDSSCLVRCLEPALGSTCPLHFQGRAVGTILHQAGFVLTEQTSLPGLWFFCQDPQQDGDSECPVCSWGLSSTKVRLQSLDVALFLFIIIHFGFFLLFTFCKTLFLQKYSCIGSLSYIGSTSPFTNTVLVQRSGYFTLSSWDRKSVV